MNTLQILPMENPRGGSRSSAAAALAGALLFTGMSGCLFGIFGAAQLLWVIAAGLITIFLCSLLGRAHYGHAALLGAVLVGFAVCMLFFDLGGGLCAMLNRISDTIGARLARNMIRLAENEAALPMAEVFAAVLIALACVWIVQSESAFIAWVIGAILLALEICLQLAGNEIWICVYLLALLQLRLPANGDSRFAGVRLLAWISMLAVCGAVLFGGAMLLKDRDFPIIDTLNEKVAETVEDVRYGEKTSTRLPEGKFSGLGSMIETGQPMLEVTMSEPESLYLRGFVGSEYTSSGWNEADPASLSDGAALFYRLHQNGFYGTTQIAGAASALDAETAAEEPITLRIQHSGAPAKYIYAPYELTDAQGLLSPDEIGDIRLRYDGFQGLDAYTLSSKTNQVKRYATLSRLLKEADAGQPDEALNNYLICESYYNSYVYSHFLDLPEETRALMHDIWGDVSFDGGTHLGYAEAKQSILEWLGENVDYGESISTKRSESDFLKDFLTASKRGYDVHYATAAVAMMRYFGIPARYVEGYLITPEQAAEAQSGEAFTLTEDAAHAWAEIYQDGIGWIPFEVTPKYMNLMEQEDALSGTGADNAQNQTTPPDSPPENSLDMTEDIHEDPEEEDAQEQHDLFIPIVRWIATISVCLLLLALLVHLLRILARQIRRRRALRLADRRQALKNLYAELHRLMRLIYRWPDCVIPSNFVETVRSDLGDDMAITYQEILNICQTAAFSEHAVSEAEYQETYYFTKQTRRLMKKRVGSMRKLKLFWKGQL